MCACGCCCGWPRRNKLGQLQVGHFFDVPVPVVMDPLPSRHVRQLALGGDYAMAVSLPGCFRRKVAMRAVQRCGDLWMTKGGGVHLGRLVFLRGEWGRGWVLVVLR